MRSLRPRRPFLVVSAVVVALLVGVQSAAAFTVISHTGSTGPYSLVDASSPIGHQAVTCLYKTSTYKLTSITARHPVVKARNRTAGRDSQWVGWQFIVQHATPSGTTFTTIHASAFIKARAYDNLAAPFANLSWAAPADPTGKYRVLVVIRWYAPGSTSIIEGQVKLRDQNYESTVGSNSLVSPDWCLQDY